jgi:hypothetical protein
MNERIEELKLKAIDFADATYKYDLNEGFKIQEWDAIRLNEFAKLIIDECIDVIDVTHGSKKLLRPYPYKQIVDNIQEHFGVE